VCVHITQTYVDLPFHFFVVQSAAPDLMREAMRKPAASSANAKKTKNISHSRLGGREGRLHVPKQVCSSFRFQRPHRQVLRVNLSLSLYLYICLFQYDYGIYNSHSRLGGREGQAARAQTGMELFYYCIALYLIDKGQA